MVIGYAMAKGFNQVNNKDRKKGAGSRPPAHSLLKASPAISWTTEQQQPTQAENFYPVWSVDSDRDR